VGDCIADAISDLIDSISSGTVTFEEAWIDIICYMGILNALSAADAATRFNDPGAENECGSSTGGRTVVCESSGGDMPEGELVTVTLQMNAPIPLADSGHSYIYSVVLDSDGDPSNNWQFVPPYDWDYFIGADRWYQLMYDHMSGTWTLNVTQVDSSMGMAPVSSNTRAVIEGDTVTFHIPKDELPADSPTWRGTAFGHDGMYSPSDRGGDVTGDDPTGPLLPLIF
jgi:hypothetical protein